MRTDNLKVGFYKAPQGAFTEDRIAEIKNRIETDFNVAIIEADFRKGVLIDGKVYVGDVCLNDLDLYFWHDTIWPSRTGSDSYYINLLRAISRDVIVINSADSTELVNDKLRAHEALGAVGLPVSEYALVYSEDNDGIARAFSELGKEVLIKPRFGGWGRGIVRCDSIGDLQDIIEYVTSSSLLPQQFLLEKYYPNDPEKWLSVSMIGQKPVIGYRKSMSIGGSNWKIYDPQKTDGKGEMSEYLYPNDELQRIAKNAQMATGKDIVGFDFIYTEKGYVIVDENGRPGLYDHCLREAGVSIVDEIVNLIGSKIEMIGKT